MASGRASIAAARIAILVGALACALAAWLWNPSATMGALDARGVRVVLVDASASVVRARPNWNAWRRAEVERQARLAESSDEELLVVTYAEGVVRSFGPEAASRFDAAAPAPLTPDDGASDLGAALSALETMLAPTRLVPARIVFLSDGEFTGVDPARQLAQQSTRGVALERIQPPPPELCDLALTQMRVPRELESGAPLAVALRIDSLQSPIAIAGTKETVRACEDVSVADGHALIDDGKIVNYERMRNSEDAKEGPLAFSEKRAPVWKGR